MATWPSRERAVAKCVDVAQEYLDTMLRGLPRFVVITAIIVVIMASVMPHRP